MLQVRLDVNGQGIYSVEITNCGPTRPELANDERLYHWADSDGNRGTVVHKRRYGARVLVQAVMAEAEAQAQLRGNDG